VLTRETAKYPEQSERNLMTIFWTKVLFGIVAYGLVVLAINLLGYENSLKQLVYLSGVTMFFDNLHTAFYSIFRAQKNLIYESIGIVGSQLLTLVIGTFALLNGWSLAWLIVAYTIPAALNALYAALAVRRVYAIAYRFSFDRAVFRSFMLLAIPFALSGIIARLYSYTDSIIISKFLGNEHLGWWSVPYKITFAFQFIPAALAASVYPAMSTLLVTDQKKIGELFEKAWSYLCMVVFPLAVGLGVIAEPVIKKLYGYSYLPSIPVLQILLASLIFGYLSFITGALLNATNHQKIQTTLFGAALVSNVILNLILLPRIGLKGAAVAALVGNIILCCGGFYFSRRYIDIPIGKILKNIFQTLVPAIIMGGVVYIVTQRAHFIVAIFAGIFVYGSLLFLSGALSRSFIVEMLNKLRGRLPQSV